MFEKTWAPKPIPETYALTEAVSEVTGVDKKALLEWVAHGLLPAPLSTRGRGIVSKWPIITLELGKFVREYRDKGFGLKEIRPFIVKAFGPRILKVLPEPRPYRSRDKVVKSTSTPTITTRPNKEHTASKRRPSTKKQPRRTG